MKADTEVADKVYRNCIRIIPSINHNYRTVVLGIVQSVKEANGKFIRVIMGRNVREWYP